MNSMNILKAIGDIDDKYLIENFEVTNERKIKPNWFKLKYILAPVCTVVIAIGGVILYNDKSNNNGAIPIKERQNVVDFEYPKEEKMSTTININKVNIMVMADLDAQEKVLNGINIPYFEYMSGLEIPGDFDNKENYKAIYVRSNKKTDNYDVLNNYEFTYKNTSNNRKITIAFSEKYTPLRDYEISGADKISKIGDTELVISQYHNIYIAKFSYKNINFDIETTDITESELISLLESIINRINNPIKVKEFEDKDDNVKEHAKEDIKGKYPSYFAGKYIDEKGNNVILLCEDTIDNRKNICKFFNITESKTIFKIGKYSYNYLEELQDKISNAMTNKELPFVVSSSLKDNTNNIVVTVTSNKEEDFEKIKKFDSIGGAIEINYNMDAKVSEDVLINK